MTDWVFYTSSHGVFYEIASVVAGSDRSERLCRDCARPHGGFPKNYSLALDNEVVSVIRVHNGPHERVGVHDHSKFPTIYVYLSDSGLVRFEHD